MSSLSLEHSPALWEQRLRLCSAAAGCLLRRVNVSLSSLIVATLLVYDDCIVRVVRPPARLPARLPARHRRLRGARVHQ